MVKAGAVKVVASVGEYHVGVARIDGAARPWQNSDMRVARKNTVERMVRQVPEVDFRRALKAGSR
jgi:hypothetical protein